MDIAKIISTNLTAWMDRSKDLDTIKKVEEKSGVGFGTVRRAKKGDANITVEKLTMIAAAFKRHPAELMIEAKAADLPALPDYGQSIPGESQRIVAAEPDPAQVYAFPSPLLNELHALTKSMSDTGLNRLIERAQQLAEQFPRAKQTPGSSQ